MARRTEIVNTCDLTGQPADETVTFGIDGRTWTIDLSAEAAAELRDLLAPYQAVARRAGKPAKRTTSTDPQRIREWARAQGLEVGDRGRIRAEIVEAYMEAA